MINKIVSFILAVAAGIGSTFTAIGDAILFPKYEMTESIEFAQSLGRGWNLGNTLEACEKHSPEKAGLETELCQIDFSGNLIEYL